MADLVLGGEVLDDGGDVEVAAVPDHRPAHLHHQVSHTQLPALGINKLLVMMIQTLGFSRMLRPNKTQVSTDLAGGAPGVEAADEGTHGLSVLVACKWWVIHSISLSGAFLTKAKQPNKDKRD